MENLKNLNEMENLTDKQIEQELDNILKRLDELKIENLKNLKEMEKNLTKEQIEESQKRLKKLRESFKK